MKIVQSRSAQSGNMRSAQKKTPASEKQNGKEQTSGKKLVQARLPFKMLVGTPPTTSLDGDILSTKLVNPPKKRKLSYTEESENPKKVGKCDSKENVILDKTGTDAIVCEEVIVLDDETEVPKTPIATSKNKRSNKSTPNNAGSSTTPKVQIKLPLSGKKRKPKRTHISAKCEVSDTSDVDLVSEANQNPNKKTKLAEDTQEQGDNLGPPVDSVKNEEPNIDVDSIKNKNVYTGSQNKKQSKMCKEGTDIKSEIDNIVLCEDKTSKVSPKSPKNAKESLKKHPSNKKNKEKNENTAEENRSLRRSTRASELDSSEQEFISEKSSAADTSINNEVGKKLLTPKQLKLMEQRKKVREEKELKLQQLKEEKDRKLQEQREERERKVQEEKLQRQKEREERELQRKKEREEKDEQKRREKEEKEEQRRKEKEEKRKKDEAKEEERRKKEEDRRRKELEKEEEENKKKKAAQAFTKFFVPKVTKPAAEDEESRDDAESIDSLAFRPFQVKGDMKLAPLVRREFKERSRNELDLCLISNKIDENSLYIAELKSGKRIPLRGSKTVLKDNEDEIIIIENELETAAQAIDEARPKPVQKYKAKFYFFRENRRPPFYGTWRKKSTVITPRRPFAADKKFFDYEVDSDDEWEEEEPGESLNGSEDEKDESEDEDYEVDNEWFVPHGHLSDEELQNEDEVGPDTSREAQKAKLKALQQEFAQEMKKKTEKIKPRLIGTIWEDVNGNRPNLCPTIIWDGLCARAMMFFEPLLVKEPEISEPEPSTPPSEKQKRLEINGELMCDLVRLVHGNRHSRIFLIKEYMEHVSSTCAAIKNGECLAPTKASIREKIDEISGWTVLNASSAKKKNKKKLCWVVSADVLDKYSLGNLGLRNEWSYKLRPKYDYDKGDFSSVPDSQEHAVKEDNSKTSKTSEHSKQKQTISGISKFTKVFAKEEIQNQLTANASPTIATKNSFKVGKSKDSPKTKAMSPALSTSNKTPLVKKRVPLLMSVPRGQQFSPQSKNTSISNYLQKNKPTTKSSAEKKSDDASVSSKVVVLD